MSKNLLRHDPMEPFLDRTIRWMRHDVEICMKSDAYVGAMKLMLGDVAALAGFYSGRTTSKPKNDEKEFMTFFDTYFHELNSLPHSIILKPMDGTRPKNLIYTHFRCGLVHEHLMKFGTAIDRRDDNNYLYLTDSGVTINIMKFYRDYLQTLEDYFQDVKQGRDNIGENFIARAKFLGAYDPLV